MTNELQPQSNSNSNPLLEGEEILWYRVLQKGFWKKQTYEVVLVSNRRVMKEYPLNGKLFTLLLSHIDDVQVLNQRRDSNAAMTGVGVRTGHLRTMQYQGQSRSKAIGSILLMSKDHLHCENCGSQISEEDL